MDHIVPHRGDLTLFWDTPSVILVGGGLSALAGLYVKSTFMRYSHQPLRAGLTGADVARQILARNGISNVRVEPVPGMLSDHYDPRTKTLRLSEPVFHERTMAAAGVAPEAMM